MGFIKQLAMFFFVVFFSGSMVFVGARDLTKSLGKYSDAERERAHRLIEALRGDELFRSEGKFASGAGAPVRRLGSYLPENDKRKIKRFLAGLIGRGFEDTIGHKEDQQRE
jgi:hypothetical protein